jgi:hypothetical protein
VMHRGSTRRVHYLLVNDPVPISYEKRIKLKLSGNEVYYTAWHLLVILKNSCCKVHCQKYSNVVLFSHDMTVCRPRPSRPASQRHAGREEEHPSSGSRITQSLDDLIHLV